MQKRTAIQIFKSLLGSGTSDVEALQMAEEIAKASGPHAVELKPNEERPDLWTEGELHRTPSREVVNVGPSQASSGGGAEKMIRDYSNPAPQKGLVIEAEKLEAMLAPLTGTMKSLIDVAKTQTGLLTVLVAAKAKEDEDEEEEEETEVVEIKAKRAKELLAKAKSLLAKAEIEKALAEDADEPAEMKVHKATARKLRKAAAKALVKAQTAALIARKKGADVRKAITELVAGNALLKADINVVEEEEEDDEEEESSKSNTTGTAVVAAPAAKAGAKEGDKGNQADKAGEGGNQDDAAKSNAGGLSPDMLASVKAALAGQTVLQGKVNEIMDVLAGKPMSQQTAPVGIVDIMKADPNAMLAQLNDKIEDAMDNGMLDSSAAMRARDMLSKYSAVRKGAMTEKLFNDQLAVTPQSVRDIFKIAA